jgi:hypothetical protein
MATKMTAVEWLIEQVNSENYQKAFGQTYISVDLIEQAKEMEKEQVMDAYNEGNAEVWTPIIYTDAKHYYTSTFNS